VSRHVARRPRALLRLAIVVAVAVGTMTVGGSPAHAADAIENRYEQPGTLPVTWSEGAPGGTTDNCNGGIGNPAGTVTYVYPTNVGQGGIDHPVIVWGNGTNPLFGDENLCPYETALRFLASWGFVVIAPNSDDVGDGEALCRAARDLIARNGNPSDVFYQRLDTSRFAVLGHSQGALGALNAALDDPAASGDCSYPFDSVISYAIPSRAWQELVGEPPPAKAAMDRISAPVFFVWGTEDGIANHPTDADRTQRTVADYAPPTRPYAAGAIVGADHVNLLPGATGYSMAWLDYTLSCNRTAAGAFVARGSTPPEIRTHTGWRHVQLQGLRDC
jgi:hypothetical protein